MISCLSVCLFFNRFSFVVVCCSDFSSVWLVFCQWQLFHISGNRNRDKCFHYIMIATASL